MSSRHAIVHVHPGNMFGGIETALCAIAEATQDGPVAHRFELGWDNRLAEELRARGASVGIIGPSRLSRPWTVWRARRRLRRRLDGCPEAVVLLHSPWSVVAYGPAARRAGMRIALWLHAPLSRSHWLDRRAASFGPEVWCANSEYTASSSAWALPGSACPVVHPPLPMPDDAEPAVNAAPRSDGRKVILTAARLDPPKGHAILLDALGMLRERTDWVCWIAGGHARPHARHVAWLRQRAVELGLTERVTWLGERSDVGRLMRQAWLLCQPNIEPEPFGLVFAEAMVRGVPVITSELGGAKQLVPDACGIRCKPGDPAALAQALRTLLDDEILRNRMSSSGPDHVRHICDPKTQAQRLATALGL